MDKISDALRDKNTTAYKNVFAALGSEELVELVAVALEDICHACWTSPYGCQCWNDE